MEEYKSYETLNELAYLISRNHGKILVEIYQGMLSYLFLNENIICKSDFTENIIELENISCYYVQGTNKIFLKNDEVFIVTPDGKYYFALQEELDNILENYKKKQQPLLVEF